MLGNLAYGGCQWGMLIAIAKAGSAEDVGRFALAFALTAPVIMFASLNLRGVLATDARSAFDFRDYLGLRLVSLGAASLVIFLVTVVLGYDPPTRIVIFLVTVAKCVESVSDVYFGFIQQHERMDWISRSLMLKGAISVLFLGAAVFTTRSVAWGAFGLVIAWSAVLFLYDIPNAGRLAANHPSPDSLRPRWNPAAQWRLARLALPLGVATLLSSLQVNVPRVFVERYLGPSELGFFAAMAYVMIVGARVVTALGESAIPRLAKHIASGELAAFRRIATRIVALAAGVGVTGAVIAALFGRPILAMLYRPEYATQSRVFTLLMIAAGIGYVATSIQYVLTSCRVYRPQPVVITASLALTASACLALVRAHGNAGAATALLLGVAFQAAAYAYLFRTATRAERPEGVH